MSGVFETILMNGIARGHLPARTQKAREWYRDAAKNFGASIRSGGARAGKIIDYGRVKPDSLINGYPQYKAQMVMPGSMYLYNYDPKHKDTLPYYDRFPLVFPFHVEADRFWAINLHYIDLRSRAQLMDALYGLANNNKYDATTKLNLSYQILKQASKFKYFKPCVKCYLTAHVKSHFMYIEPEVWDIAIFMPLERFEKATKTQVFAESRKKIK